MLWTPHTYQQRAKSFLIENSAIVILPIGGGKTSTALAAAAELLDKRRARNCLIIAPKAVAVDTWPAEADKWDFMAGRSFTVATGEQLNRIYSLSLKADFTTINYDNLEWLADAVKLFKYKWDIIIIDEIQRFKQYNGVMLTRFLHYIRPHAAFVWGLTAGLLTENDWQDIFGPMKAVDQGLTLGDRITHYRRKYFIEGKAHWDWKLREGADAEIMAAINARNKMVQIDPAEIAAQLPEKTDITRAFTLRPAVQKMHDDHKAELISILESGEPITSPNAAAALNKCRQIVSGAVYNATGDTVRIHDDKLDLLREVVGEAAGEPVIIAYAYKHELEAMQKLWPEAREARTAGALADWRRGKLSKLLLHPASAGEGLNLQDGGRILIWLTPPWSLRLYSQTVGRIFRQGQRKAVLNFSLVARKTVETLVIRKHQGKRVTQESFLAELKRL